MAGERAREACAGVGGGRGMVRGRGREYIPRRGGSRSLGSRWTSRAFRRLGRLEQISSLVGGCDLGSRENVLKLIICNW